MIFSENTESQITLTSIKENDLLSNVSRRIALAYNISFTNANNKNPDIVSFFNECKKLNVIPVPKYKNDKYFGTTFVYNNMAIFGSKISDKLSGANIVNGEILNYNSAMDNDIKQFITDSKFIYMNKLEMNKDISKRFEDSLKKEAFEYLTFIKPVNHNVEIENGFKVGDKRYAKMSVSKTFVKKGDYFEKHSYNSVNEDGSLQNASAFAVKRVPTPNNLEQLADIIARMKDYQLISGSALYDGDKLYNRKANQTISMKDMSTFTFESYTFTIPFQKEEFDIQAPDNFRKETIAEYRKEYIAKCGDKISDMIISKLKEVVSNENELEYILDHFDRNKNVILNYRATMISFMNNLKKDELSEVLNGKEILLKTVMEQPEIVSQNNSWAMLDIDKFELPEGFDSNRNPEQAIKFWIIQHLPEEYHDVGFYYQLSSSAGFVKNDNGLMEFNLDKSKNTLNAHFFIMFDKPINHKHFAQQLKEHTKSKGLSIDLAVLSSPNQIHYIAPPHIEGGELLPARDGIITGKLASLDYTPSLLFHDSMDSDTIYNESITPAEGRQIQAGGDKVRFEFLSADEAYDNALSAFKSMLSRMGDRPGQNGFLDPWRKACGAFIKTYITANPWNNVEIKPEIIKTLQSAVITAYKKPTRTESEWKNYLEPQKTLSYIKSGIVDFCDKHNIQKRTFQDLKNGKCSVDDYLYMCKKTDLVYFHKSYLHDKVNGFVDCNNHRILVSKDMKGLHNLSTGATFGEFNIDIDKPKQVISPFRKSINF